MSTRTLSRKSKAATIVPLAIVSGLWTASLAGVGATANASNKSDDPLPDGARVPSKAIEAPASVPIPGAIAPGVPAGAADSVVGGASTSGIPSPALAAYQRGAQIIGAADKTCNIPWELIAAIGRVESDHGRYGGNVLNANGVSTPGIYGIALNGQNNTQAISDTDGGEIDRDKVYDRAVGPMQFIPSTWSVVKVDADGDGKRNPQDIDDASLASAVYLCSGAENLSTRAGQEKAVLRYNHSNSYVQLVLRIMEAYSKGDYSAVPSGTYGGTTFSPSYSSAIQGKRKAAAKKQQAAAKPGAPGSTPGTGTPGSPGTPGTGTPGSPGTPGTGTPGSPGTPGGGSNPVGETLQNTTNAVKATVEGTVKTVSKTLAQTQCTAEALTKPLDKTWFDKCMSRLGW